MTASALERAQLRELLPLYALGILDADEAQLVEQAIAADAELAAELVAYQDTTDQLVDAVPPAAEVAARLLASVGGGRFERFAAQLGGFFDVTVERARELLGLIERAASWHPQLPGIELVHFDGGPAYANADCGFIRLAPGAVFPPHTHVGAEVTIILQGTVRDTVDDRVLRPGDEYVQHAGSSHALICESAEDCIFAARAVDGIEIAGAPARPRV